MCSRHFRSRIARQFPSSGAARNIRISNDNGSEDYEMSAAVVIDQLFKRMHRMALANLPDHVCLRAVTGNQGGASVSDSGAEKFGQDDLGLRLLLAGFDISGDELAVLLDGKAVAFPRRFIVRGDCVELLPELNSCEEFATYASNPARETVIHFDPTRLGRPWLLVPRHVSAVILSGTKLWRTNKHRTVRQIGDAEAHYAALHVARFQTNELDHRSEPHNR